MRMRMRNKSEDSRVKWPIRLCKDVDEIWSSCCKLVVNGPRGCEDGLSSKPGALEDERRHNVSSNVGVDWLSIRVLVKLG
jgi:hypothetical protein